VSWQPAKNGARNM